VIPSLPSRGQGVQRRRPVESGRLADETRLHRTGGVPQADGGECLGGRPSALAELASREPRQPTAVDPSAGREVRGRRYFRPAREERCHLLFHVQCHAETVAMAQGRCQALPGGYAQEGGGEGGAGPAASAFLRRQAAEEVRGYWWSPREPAPREDLADVRQAIREGPVNHVPKRGRARSKVRVRHLFETRGQA
jgi:hypothetical protein